MKGTLVYDSECGPCSKFKTVVDFLDPRGKLSYLSMRDAELAGALSSVKPDLRWRSFHLISPGSAVASGTEALPSLAAFLPGGGLVSKAMTSCSPLNHAVAFGYSALSRMHDRGSCAVPSERRLADS